ncbi:MAG: hypothetical protein H2173_02085, partial [Opitutus sp.]|nr:hypothetical protein [Opitutus sp.]
MSKLALICGDPAGVGPEIIAAWLAARSDQNHGRDAHATQTASLAAQADTVAVIGPARWLAGLPADVEKIAVGPADYAATLGAPDDAGARVALAAVGLAGAGGRGRRFSGGVSGPGRKGGLAGGGGPFSGQT